MARDVERIRKRVNDHLEHAGKGEAARLAHEAGISPGTLSKFRSGTYTGKAAAVAARLAQILQSRDTAEAIASGRFKLAWLVNTRNGLRLIKRVQALDALRALYPDAHVLQVWQGKEPHDVHIVIPAKAGIQERNPEGAASGAPTG